MQAHIEALNAILAAGDTNLQKLAAALPAPVCVAHGTHRPANLTIEWHHIVPVAWQLRTTVPQPPSPGADTDGRGMLWDNRGAWLCPTGHRNVHHWIVTMMHLIAAAPPDKPANPEDAYLAVKPHRSPPELLIALEGLTRYAPYGALLALTAAGEWGEA